MRHTVLRNKPRADGLFVGPKCATSIPVTTSLHLDILIQASLDPSVTKIDHVPIVDVAGVAVRLDAVVVTRNGERHAVELPELSSLRDVDEEGLVLLAVRKLDAKYRAYLTSDVRGEPMCSNARTIWGYRHLTLSIENREHILAAIENNCISLHQLAAFVSLEVPLLSAVCALACEGVLAIDLFDAPLSYASKVRSIVPGFTSSNLAAPHCLRDP